MLKTLTSPPQTSENYQTQLSCQGKEFQPTRDLHLITWTSKKREGRILHADVFFPPQFPLKICKLLMEKPLGKAGPGSALCSTSDCIPVQGSLSPLASCPKAAGS